MEHALRSASGADTWMNCPGSIKAQQGIESQSSTYSEEGTRAHKMCESMLMGDITHNIEQDDEMVSYCKSYVDYVRSLVKDEASLYIEKRVEFSYYVEDGFGTVDAMIVDLEESTVHIIDFKYGAGIKVDAFENKQLMLYALGCYQTTNCMWSIDNIIIHIFQPRMDNISTYEITIDELLEFGEEVKKASMATIDANAPRITGLKQCQWCKAKIKCKEFLGITTNVIDNSGDDETLKYILDNEKLINMAIKTAKDYAFKSINEGNSFDGYKIVEARTNRKFTEEGLIELKEKLGDKAFINKPITLSQAEKLLSKEEVNGMTIRTSGKPTLAKESDKRKSLTDEFEDLT
ncbi:hypothetical protein BJAS_P3486 [Bathymodiolus japonicus methanotrophic gill symbiont]|uniref:DUF2800 domain-containing protein n=1 Tax=Bathymodiolus japonicus methanotrophic gill symbiont TaxID=113269 RepID=UPI001B645770|nr:DUF2800 domain-containing protein [Bathymodiolus japonicus methanotrophic gill symbiont]GFO72949.1 hypothetical protein BJAS_P3486 [Bathymodiolus japonicus methanotrophic gill symbiont]